MKIELWRSQLFEREASLVGKEGVLADHEELLAAREASLASADAALAGRRAQWSLQQEQQLMLHEEHLARCVVRVERQCGELHSRFEELDRDRSSLLDAETRLQQRVRPASPRCPSLSVVMGCSSGAWTTVGASTACVRAGGGAPAPSERSEAGRARRSCSESPKRRFYCVRRGKATAASQRRGTHQHQGAEPPAGLETR